MTKNGQGLVDIGKLVLTFAKINRATYHEDGLRPESDTDHTVMVSVCACALAHKLYPDSLDRGLVAQFAIVHDLVEVYADDTDSFGISEKDRKVKEIREQEALKRITEEFHAVYPWIPEMIAQYEALEMCEARFVKTVDKLMNKITHILNKGTYFRSKGMSKDTMWSEYQTSMKPYEVLYGTEFPELLALMDELITEARIQTYGS